MEKNRLIWRFVPCLMVLAAGAILGPGASRIGSGAAAQAPAGWVELIRTPAGPYGPQAGYGRWRALANTGFTGPGCTYQRYRPAAGPDASWWTVGYDDSVWSDTGYRTWQPDFAAWGFLYLPEVGSAVWTAAPPCCGQPDDDAWFDPVSTTLHRRHFIVSSTYVVSRARIKVFSDNVSTIYLNDTLIVEHGGAGAAYEFSPLILRAGENVLAIQLSNDCSLSNFMGLQYVLEVQYLDPTPTPTPTQTPTPPPSWSGSVTDDGGVPVGGIPVELRGRYDDCSGGTAEQLLASALTGVSGTYRLLLPAPPAAGCGWQGLAIVEALPWNAIYRPLSAVAPPPGWVHSASEIRYPWTATGSYGGNDFVVERIPVDLTLWADYPYLVLRGPELPPPAGPLPAQVLRGRYSGPLPLGGRQVEIHIWDGSVWDTYTVFTTPNGAFALTPAFAGEPLLGTTRLGTWQGYAETIVAGAGAYLSPDLFWRVRWFPVHLRK